MGGKTGSWGQCPMPPSGYGPAFTITLITVVLWRTNINITTNYIAQWNETQEFLQLCCAQVPTGQARRWCQLHGEMPYFEVSSLSGERVHDAFTTTVRLALEHKRRSGLAPDYELPPAPAPPPANSGCACWAESAWPKWLILIMWLSDGMTRTSITLHLLEHVGGGQYGCGTWRVYHFNYGITCWSTWIRVEYLLHLYLPLHLICYTLFCLLVRKNYEYALK